MRADEDDRGVGASVECDRLEPEREACGGEGGDEGEDDEVDRAGGEEELVRHLVEVLARKVPDEE